jgi:hypothetical protein
MHPIEDKPALILICGYARAGKDTLGDGILDGAARPAVKVALAEPLKDSAETAIREILGGVRFPGFSDQAFKTANRNLLVELGRTCRALHQDCFVELAIERAHQYIKAGASVVITDVRYTNELQRFFDYAKFRGVHLHCLLIETAGVEAANEEERTNQAMLLIRAQDIWADRSRWQPNQAAAINQHGKELAQRFRI